MFLKRLIPSFIKQYLIYIVIKYKSKVKIGKRCKIDYESIFEGYNCILNKVEIKGSKIGLGTYIANNSIIRKTNIGRFCAIGENVRTGLGIHPTERFVSISPSFYSLNSQTGLSFTKKQLFEEHKYIDSNNKIYCEIGNDVWIGNNVMIMDGIIIGDGAIIAGGTIVTKNVKPYSIIGGIPGKEIRKRFSEDQIEKLLKIKWWNWKLKKIEKHSKHFDNIQEFIDKFK